MIARVLRICHLGKYYPPAPGGVETHVRTLAQAQAALGLNVRVICVHHAWERKVQRLGITLGGSHASEEHDNDVQVSRLSRTFSAAGFDVCPQLPDVLGRLEQSGVDLLHLHTPNPSMLLPLATLCRSIPVVITHHSDVIRQKLLQYAVLPFERLVYGRAARILSDSPPYAAGSATLQRYAGKLESLPLGLDLETFLQPAPAAEAHAARLRQQHGSPLWLCVGRLVYYKGLQHALAALQKVPGKLLIIGTGPLLGTLRQQAEALGVADRVIWHGHASAVELTGAYLAATAFWFPSNARSEGFGLVQVEAMASGCPVINTSIPASGVPWVSPHDVSGLTVAMNSPHELAAAALRLLQEPGLRDRLASAARLRAIREFDARAMGLRSLEIYRRVLADGLPRYSQPPRRAAGEAADLPRQTLATAGILSPADEDLTSSLV